MIPNFHSKTFQHSGLSTLRVCSTRWKRRSLAKSWARCSTCGLKTSWCWAKSQSPAFPNHWPPSYPEFSNHVPSNWRYFCDRSDALDPHTDSRVLQGTSGVPDGCGGTHWRITLGTKCKKGTTPLGFICCCVCSLHATIPFRFMCWRTSCKKGYNTFRVYMLLDLVQEGQRQLYGLCIALNVRRPRHLEFMVYNLYVVTLNVRIATTPSGFIYVVALIVRKHLLYDGLRHLKGLQVVHLMFKELRHLLGLYDALNVSQCKKCLDNIRVYILLHLLQEGLRHLKGIYAVAPCTSTLWSC